MGATRARGGGRRFLWLAGWTHGAEGPIRGVENASDCRVHDVPRERYVAPAVSRSWQVSEEEEDESGCGMDAAWMRHGCGMVADEEMRWTCERDWRCMAAWREVRIGVCTVELPGCHSRAFLALGGYRIPCRCLRAGLRCCRREVGAVVGHLMRLTLYASRRRRWWRVSVSYDT